MKRKIREKLPDSIYLLLKKLVGLLKIFKFLLNYRYDLSRFLKHSSSLDSNSQFKLEAAITETYHVLEKGLCMVNPRLGFGQAKAENLIFLLNRYIKSGYSTNRTQIQSAIAVLKEYFEFHDDFNDENINKLKEKASKLFNEQKNQMSIEGGKITITKESILKGAKGDFKDLAFSRYSIRNFSPEDVDINRVKEAIRIAQKTPSACNRQSSRTYIIKSKLIIDKVLSIQNGNRGFGHLFNTLLIVTSDLNAFHGAHERNQSFIDGGMYSMSLLYALHYEGIGACPLNWSVVKDRDQELRKIVGIVDSENIIMIIGIGDIPNKIDVGVSQRKYIEEVIKVV